MFVLVRAAHTSLAHPIRPPQLLDEQAVASAPELRKEEEMLYGGFS